MKPPKAPTVYFDTRNGSYWLEIAPRRYMPLGKADAAVHLMKAGINGNVKDEQGLTQVDLAFHAAQIERAMDYCGPLAGYQAGPFETRQGKKVLVTVGYRFTEAKKGKTPLFDRFLSQLLGDGQADVFKAWVKFRRASLLRGDFKPAQVLILAGPSSCGKSFLQHLITELIGGRSASPWQYMLGQSAFNAHLAEAEHLAIEEAKDASIDIRSRNRLGEAFKELIVVQDMHVHAKGKQPLSLPTYRAVTMSVNDELEKLMVLPPIDGSLADKIILLKCSPATLDEDRLKNMREFGAELPAFAAQCDAMEIPKQDRCPRYGFKAWQNPDLLEFIQDQAPETQLLTIIEETVLACPEGFWQGSAEALKAELLRTRSASSVSQLLSYPSACGTLLGRIRMKHPDRIESVKRRGLTVWRIRR